MHRAVLKLKHKKSTSILSRVDGLVLLAANGDRVKHTAANQVGDAGDGGRGHRPNTWERESTFRSKSPDRLGRFARTTTLSATSTQSSSPPAPPST